MSSQATLPVTAIYGRTEDWALAQNVSSIFSSDEMYIICYKEAIVCRLVVKLGHR